MRVLDFEGLAREADAWDARVAQSPEIDRFCTSSAWINSARAAFCPEARPCVAVRGDAAVALMVMPVGTGGRFGGLPLEAGWGLAAPFVGPDPAATVELLGELWARPPGRMDALFLSGVPPMGRWMNALLDRFARHRVGFGQRCLRRQAWIGDGLDGFFGRRSPKFRATLRRATRRAAGDGVVFERVASGPIDAVYDRILRVEKGSWKGQQAQGIDQPPTVDFYRMVIERLVARDALRVVFATRDGQDLAYVLGGLFGDTYRGLQVSFDDAFGALSAGNLVQHAMIEWLVEDGVRVYDLGTDMPYKQRWGERTVETVTVAVLPRAVGFARFFGG